jgi:hypothetical protein
MTSLQRACAIAGAAPIVVAMLFLGTVSLGEALGTAPLAGQGPVNGAEAAGMGSAFSLIRFLRAGESPHRVYPIRPEIISSSVRRATTLEAAMWSRQLELIQLLDREGAFVGDGQRRDLACLAADLDLPDVVEYLAPQGTAHCQPGQAYQRVLARTSGDASEASLER